MAELQNEVQTLHDKCNIQESALEVQKDSYEKLSQERLMLKENCDRKDKSILQEQSTVKMLKDKTTEKESLIEQTEKAVKDLTAQIETLKADCKQLETDKQNEYEQKKEEMAEKNHHRGMSE